MSDLCCERPRAVAVSGRRSRRPRVPGRDSGAISAVPSLLGLLLVLASILLGLRPSAAGTPDDGYRLGVFPYLPVLTIDRIFGPIAASFAQDLDRPVYLKTKSNLEKFAEELAQERYDIIFVHPFFYLDAADRHHYRALARIDQPLTGVVMVGEERNWHDWRDLVGRTLALPPQLGTASEMVKAALVDAGLRPGVDVLLQHYRTMIACLQAVVVGSADACAIPRFGLTQIGSIADMRLHVMMETGPINNFLFAVHERVPEAARAKLLGCVLAWSQTEAGRAVLTAGGWAGFVPAEDRDYNQVRRYSTRLEVLAQP